MLTLSGRPLPGLRSPRDLPEQQQLRGADSGRSRGGLESATITKSVGRNHQIALPIVLGATGAGKSALALAIALALDGEMVSCDSLQVYRFFDRGTA